MKHKKMILKMRKTVKLLILIVTISSNFLMGAFASTEALTSFSTGGHSVYYLHPATVNNSGNRAIVAATYDGTVLCHASDGAKIWENKVNNYFPFDLAVADIDDDGLDEIFVATAGGTVDAFDSDGQLLWTYSTIAPLYQVCPIKTSDGKWVILTGGIEENVVVLKSDGSMIKIIDVGDVVRHIRKGNIMGNGTDFAAVATTSSGLAGMLSLMLFDPSDMTKLWHKVNIGAVTETLRRVFSMEIFDVNDDGNEDIILSASGYEHGRIVGYDNSGSRILDASSSEVPVRVYQMNMITKIGPVDGQDEQLFGIFGRHLILYDKNGIVQNVLSANYNFTNGAFDPQNNTYYLGSSPSGGDGIYALHLSDEGWQDAFKQIKPIGKLSKVEDNIAVLKNQIAVFTKPDYQCPPSKVNIMAPTPELGVYNTLQFSSPLLLSEKITDSSELWCRDTDNRRTYDMAREDILDLVRQKETQNENFIVNAGHGKAFYMSPQTMEGIINEAPNHFKGFLFTEMEDVDSEMQEVIENIIFPLAEKCSIAGKKIFFDNKNIFWNGSCYINFWKSILLNPQFSDVFVPNLEETNCRTQELSLAGRVGLWQTGSFDDWAMRVVDDNACFDRMREWSSQQVLSHFLRQLVYQSSLGAKYLSVDVVNALRNQVNPFYDLLEKGAVVIPEKDELLSLSDLCLGMKSPPAEDFMTHGINGHDYNFSIYHTRPKVFDRLDCYWGGAPILDHDFSSYGYGCDRRMLNFMPRNPYGLVTIVPDDIDIDEFPQFKNKVTTDGSKFYESDIAFEPESYKQTMIDKLSESANRLPVLVQGDVAWSVVRLDSNHVRVTIVDPVYLDPANREATIILQNLSANNCTDILSGEKLAINNNRIQLTVPAGVFRIVDIAHQTVALTNLEIFPNPVNNGILNLRITKTGLNNTEFNIGQLTGLIRIYDLTGKLCFSKDINHHTGGMVQVNLDNGIYIVTLLSDGQSISGKILVE